MKDLYFPLDGRNKFDNAGNLFMVHISNKCLGATLNSYRKCHQNFLFPGIHLCPSLFLIFERPLVQKFSYGYHLNWRYLSQIFPVCC